MSSASEQLVSQLKALADPVRLRIVALCSYGEASVTELTDAIGQSQPRVSQHLKILCDAGLLERFRDGHFVYYRLPARGPRLDVLLSLLPKNEPDFERDISRLRERRGSGRPDVTDDNDRPLHRALVELAIATPLGDLIDIGCGQGKLLKLLASRTKRAVGVDIDADARKFARAELLLAGLPNCTLRKADMHALPYADGEFDTVILDDVLRDAAHPVKALTEASRLVSDSGRLLILTSLPVAEYKEVSAQLADWCAVSRLRLAPPRGIPAKDSRWLLAVAVPIAQTVAA